MKTRSMLITLVLLTVFITACDLDSESDNQQLLLTGDLRIENVTVGEPELSEHYRMITFDIRWAYSWRRVNPSVNWDAAWVFIKYKENNGEWRHATLSILSEEHSAPSAATIDPPPDGKGVYIYRSQLGEGEFSVSDVSLRWNYGIDAVGDSSTIEVKVLGLEMVYIPEGSFYAGDNSASIASFKKGSNDTRPWHILSEDAIIVTNTAADGFYYTSSKDFWNDTWNSAEDVSGTEFTIPAEFPKGYRAIYCMKYELTQQQYIDFLNTLTETQASNRYDSNNFNMWGYTISREGNTFTTANPQRACGFLSLEDGFAYADWAGLRPMTEFEFEKICRGSEITPIELEFAWGSTYCKNADYDEINGDESDREYFTSTSTNTYYQETGSEQEFPLNSGIFFEVDKTRELSGASYYGVLDMSGNMAEMIISVGNKYGRVFTYHNSDGILTSDGFANEPNWPERSGLGTGIRGGNFAEERRTLTISYRLSSTVNLGSDHRHIPIGWRGVRTE